MDAFHEGANFLVIHPDECIDCGVCVPECPVEAIYADGDVPSGLQQYVALNAELANDWPAITRKIDPLPEASHWAKVRDKLTRLKRA